MCVIEWPSPHSSAIPEILRDESLCRTSDFEKIRDLSNSSTFFEDDYEESLEYTWVTNSESFMNLTIDYEEEFQILQQAGWNHDKCKQWLEKRIKFLHFVLFLANNIGPIFN